MEPNDRPDLAPAEPAVPQPPPDPLCRRRTSRSPPRRCTSRRGRSGPSRGPRPNLGRRSNPACRRGPPRRSRGCRRIPACAAARDVRAAPGTPSWALPAPPVQAGPAPGILYAGFGVRLVAYVIDWVILGIVSGIIWFGALVVGISAVGVDRFSTLSTVSSTFTPDETAAALTFAQYVYAGLGIAWLVTALYFILMWHTGGTVGMRALGLRVAREEDGRPIGIGRATARYLGYLVDWLALGIGLLWVGVDSRKQGWHDKIAGTFVVKRA